jgi:hypothetical protein
MLLIMRKFFIKTIVVSFCFVSFNTQAFESTYLICKNNYETTVFGFVVTLKDRARNMANNNPSATGYVANSKGNGFESKRRGSDTGDVVIWKNTFHYRNYVIDRTTGQAFMRWQVCTQENKMMCNYNPLGDSGYELKEEFIGNCNAVSESEAKAKARQLYTPASEPKRKF